MAKNNASHSNKTTVCEKIFGIARRTPQRAQPQSPLGSSGWVPIVFENASSGKPTLTKRASSMKMEKIEVIGVGEGNNKQRPARVFSEYLEQAGSRIRVTSNVAARKPSIRRDSFNNKVSNYINRTKFRFAMPSFVENGKFPEGFERK